MKRPDCSPSGGEPRLTPWIPHQVGHEGVIGTGTDEEIRRAVTDVLRAAPDRFVLGADYTVPADTRWESLRTGIATAHAFRSSTTKTGSL